MAVDVTVNDVFLEGPTNPDVFVTFVATNTTGELTPIDNISGDFTYIAPDSPGTDSFDFYFTAHGHTSETATVHINVVDDDSSPDSKWGPVSAQQTPNQVRTSL